MTMLLQFIARLAPFLYALIAAGIFFAIRGLIRGQRQRRVAAFGLEREAAGNQMRRAATSVLTLLILAALVYAVKNVVIPATSGVAEAPTPTPEALVVEGTAMTPTPSMLLFPTVTPTPGLPPAEAEAEATQDENVVGCEIVGATITSPSPGDIVSGQVSVEGEVNVIDFQQYKFEVRGPSTGDAWIVVGTYYETVSSGLLGVWDSTSLQPGSYTLRLVIHRTDGTTIPPCEVPISIERSSVAG
jgi:hypothetical protein